jgi:hypothetical protein
LRHEAILCLICVVRTLRMVPPRSKQLSVTGRSRLPRVGDQPGSDQRECAAHGAVERSLGRRKALRGRGAESGNETVAYYPTSLTTTMRTAANIATAAAGAGSSMPPDLRGDAA